MILASILTLGQARDVCLQIRAWREAGELERAAYWSRRLRAEKHVCSVDECLSEPLPDRPWCELHRMVRIVEPPTSSRRQEVLRLLALAPPLSDGEVGRRAGITPQRVRQIRADEGIPNRDWRRRGYVRERDLPRRARMRMFQEQKENRLRRRRQWS